MALNKPTRSTKEWPAHRISSVVSAIRNDSRSVYRSPYGTRVASEIGSANADTDSDSNTIIDVFSIYFGIVAEVKSNFLAKRVDEKVKKLVLMDFTVCLVVNTPSASGRFK
ncbi:hypothetical protein [Halalkalicoccus paucihalophilus]|uniref:hypothetical protein n=1 Tax=Halalkalicoccus paucihalophilus TaxID=1008153 RepID=UPI0012ECC032|nr:hypothetical protein [Halalkalicoccus paucihalophilus]